jgi:hypothetical protein
LRDKLSVFKKIEGLDRRNLGHFLRRSPAKWAQDDGQVVADAIMNALSNPVSRPADKARLARRPSLFRAKRLGTVTVPDAQAASDSADGSVSDSSANDVIPSTAATEREPESEIREHTETQWLLLKMGNDMGLDIWVARNDRGRSYAGHRFADLPRIKQSLPAQFDDATNRTIEHIDVLWLRGNAIVAAFEIESTTSIYSGLLRMSDLISMQPNLNIRLYIVAPDARRNKVLEEVNRPTFSRLHPPLSSMCRLISISAIRKRLAELGGTIRYLKPEFVEDELSESCEIETD